MVSLVRLRSPFVALIAAATTLTAITFSTSSCNRNGGDDGEGAEEGPPPEQAEPPNVDLDAVHKAFGDMKGATQTEQLQSFEQEVNKYNYGDDFVSVDAEKRNDDQGNPTTVVTGYVDKKNGQGQGFNKDTDTPVFRFVQTAPPSGNNVNYEYLDGYGNVYYRGTRAFPQTPFYNSYYYGRGPVARYYTPYARIGYLRSWRVGWRSNPGYLGWRTRFGGWRSGYYGRVVGLRSTYGVSRARIGVRFGGYGYRGGFRGGYRGGAYRGGGVRRSYGGGGRSYGGGGRRRR